MKINELYKLLIYLILISSIGVYVIPSMGLRTDTIILYFSMFLVIFLAIKQKKIVVNDAKFLLIFSIIVFTPILITLIIHQNLNLKFLSGAESLISSLVIIFIFSLIRFTSEMELLTFFQNVSIIYLVILSISATLSILSLNYDLTSLNILLWGSESAVGFLANSNFRYPGIFNLPVEAGIANTVGVFTLYFVKKYKLINETLIIIFSMTILIGGILSISKVFLLFGLPLLIIGLIINTGIKNIVTTFIFIIVVSFLSQFIFSEWLGVKFITRLITNLLYSDSLLSNITAGRFGGENSQQFNYISKILSDYPIFGSGLGSMPILDSTITFILSSGGIVYFIIFLFSMIFLLVIYKNKIIPQNKLTLLTFIYIVFLVMVSIGTPILWLNKINLYLWLFLLMIFRLQDMLSIKRRKSQKYYE